MTDFRNDIRDYLDLERKVIASLDVDAINATLNLFNETRLLGGTIWICGNGGSAATASHFQNDFNKGVSQWITPPFRFHCLNDNVATLTAVANDIGYEEVFRFPLRNNVDEQDILVAISGSGNSANIMNAVEYAHEQGAKVVGITGFDGGKLALSCDISLNAPVSSMQITEDIHMIFDHLMMSMFYKHLAGKNHLKTGEC